MTIGIGLGIILGHLMESYLYGGIIGIAVGLALGSRWAKKGLPPNRPKFLEISEQSS